jgi:nucleotide-binding universal stress UspA family protein
MTVRHIVAGVDGSENSRRALAWAAELARALRAELVVVHALGLLDRLADGEPVPTAAHRDAIVEAFEHSWCAPLADAGVTARRMVRDGTPVDVLLAVAEHEEADLIVVGSRGIGNVPERILGSTSHQLAARSIRPVVIVPEGVGSGSTSTHGAH